MSRAKHTEPVFVPSLEELEEERRRLNRRSQFGSALGSTVGILLVVAAIAVLLATLCFPVLRIYGSSMSPTLAEGEIVVAVKTTDLEQGDLVCFYYGNKLLVKRYIAGAGQWVNIDENGVVSVDGVALDEPYLTDAALGECDIELPYQVPEGKIFVMGDHRSTSVDSRSTAVGCVSEEQLIGKLILRVWPLPDFRVLS